MGYEAVVKELRSTFNSGRTIPLVFRLKQLRALDFMIKENHEKIVGVLKMDLRKPQLEVEAFEIGSLRHEIYTFLRNLKKWGKPETVPHNLLLPAISGSIHREPYGVVLILGTWNCPILLSLMPLVGAIAGGNVVILKPSECAPYSAKLLAELLPRYLDPECYKIVLGDARLTKELLSYKFDYIFATGGINMGKAVMEAAAKNLTPVTLELGGKNPVYIDDNCDIEHTVRRILWGKCTNAGQLCISPDYVLCSKKVELQFVQIARDVIQEWYGEDTQTSPDFGRIINPNHFLRISSLLKQTLGYVVVGGETSEQDLFIAPTIVVNVTPMDELMQEEIFGPVLSIVNTETLQEAVNFIKDRPKPLAAYVFSKSKKVTDFFVNNVPAGGITCNDTLIQAAYDNLPFGGVGASGMGAYTGRNSYETFTHPKAVVTRDFSIISKTMDKIRSPPYTEEKLLAVKARRWLGLFELPRGITAYVAYFLKLSLLGILALFGLFAILISCTNWV